MIKAIAKSKPGAFLFSRLIGFYIWILRRTIRVETQGDAHVDQDKGGQILAFWHGRLVIGPIFANQSRLPVHMLISTHRDGEIIADAIRLPRLRFIRGSAANPKKLQKEKSGGAAVVQMIAALRAGDFVGITPDGPRGPARHVQPGIVRLASQARVPIVPLGLAVSRSITLGTWDRGCVPLPFAKVAVIAGAPYSCPAELTVDEVKTHAAALSTCLNEVTDLADKKVGNLPKRAHTTGDIDERDPKIDLEIDPNNGQNCNLNCDAGRAADETQRRD